MGHKYRLPVRHTTHSTGAETFVNVKRAAPLPSVLGFLDHTSEVHVRDTGLLIPGAALSLVNLRDGIHTKPTYEAPRPTGMVDI